MNGSVQLDEGDALILTKDHTSFYNKCCDCGLVHRIEIKWHRNKGGGATLRFYREDGEPDLSGLEVETIVEKA